MWKASTNVTAPAPDDAEDWETDPDFVNDVTEQEQRWGPGGRNVEAIDMAKLREEVLESDKISKMKQYEDGPKSSFGYGGKFGVQDDRMDKSAVGHDYTAQTEKHVSQKDYAQGFGGKFGVQKDRMDKSAVGHDYVSKVEKHVSQTDYAQGFGGKYGVQTDRLDKSAAGWEHKEEVQKHSSQKDYSVGFGGKFGVQSDRMDASALGWDHREKAQQHDSQKDYAIGFGGKFGVQKDRQDASALSWDHQEKVAAHGSQTDHKKGFGGKFGVESDRVDKSAHKFDQMEKVGTNYVKQKPDIGGAKPSSIRAKFEKMALEKEQEAQQSVRRIRQERELVDKELSQKEKDRVTEEPEPQSKQNIPQAVCHQDVSPQYEVKEGRDQFPQAANLPDITRVLSPGRNDCSPVAAVGPDHNINSLVETTAINQIDDDDSPDSSQRDYKVPNSGRVGFATADGINRKHTREDFEQDTTGVIPRMPTIVMSPVGWESEAEPEDEDGYRARALFDYQASAPDEISFDPDDIITNIVMVDEGWWQGLCKGAFGLFPANYVQLQDK